MRDDVLQTNAADAAQVEHARRTVRTRERDEADLTRKQLATYEGRAFVWREIERHGVFADIDGAVEHVYAQLGKRREGLRLLAETQQHAELFSQMWAEARARADRLRKEHQAATAQHAAHQE